MHIETVAVARPPIIIADTEADTLTELALAAAGRLPLVSRLLLEEIDRAECRPSEEVPDDVVTMGSRVTFVDEASGAEHSVQLVYPAEADLALHRLSILTPVGTGLIGMRPGQSIRWPDLSGHERNLTIVSVSRPGARG